MELLAAAPLICLLAVGVAQLACAGFAQWQLHEAARDAARASHVVANRMGNRAAERAAVRVGRDVVGGLGEELRVRQVDAGDVVVSAKLPLLAPYRQLFASPPRLSARSRFGR